LTHMVCANTEPSHAGVNLHVHRRGQVRIARRLIECLEQVGPVDNRSQTLLQTYTFLARPESAKAKNRPRNAGRTKLESLFRQSHSEPISAFAFKPARAFRSAMTISIRFHRSENLYLVADVISNHAKIVRKGVEIDLGP